MTRAACLVLLVAACAQPKQPLTPSYFHAQPQAPPTYASCQETVSCYAGCSPVTEQCMQACDSAASPNDAQNARALTACVSASRCPDEACTQQQCGAQLALCTNERQPVPTQ